MVLAFMYTTWEHLQAGLDYFMSFLKSGRYSSLVFIVAKPPISDSTYRKISNIRRTKSPKLNASRLVLQLYLPNPTKPGVKSRMKM